MKKILLLLIITVLYSICLTAAGKTTDAGIDAEYKYKCDDGPTSKYYMKSVPLPNGGFIKMYHSKSKPKPTNSGNVITVAPFPLPQNYSTSTNFFLFTEDDEETGIGVIGGMLYSNDNDEDAVLYYWTFTSSTIYDNFTEFEAELDSQ